MVIFNQNRNISASFSASWRDWSAILYCNVSQYLHTTAEAAEAPVSEMALAASTRATMAYSYRNVYYKTYWESTSNHFKGTSSILSHFSIFIGFVAKWLNERCKHNAQAYTMHNSQLFTYIAILKCNISMKTYWNCCCFLITHSINYSFNGQEFQFTLLDNVCTDRYIISIAIVSYGTH